MYQLDASSHSSVSYYLAAEGQLEIYTNLATLPCVQARLLMVLFPAMSSHMDQSWSLLGKKSVLPRLLASTERDPKREG